MGESENDLTPLEKENIAYLKKYNLDKLTREELAQKDVEFFLKTNPSSKILNSLMDLKSDFKKGDDVKILQKEYLKRKPPVYDFIDNANLQ